MPPQSAISVICIGPSVSLRVHRRNQPVEPLPGVIVLEADPRRLQGRHALADVGDLEDDVEEPVAVVAPELVHPSRFRRRRDEFDDGLAETVQRGLQFKVTDHLVSGDQVIPNAISKCSAASLT